MPGALAQRGEEGHHHGAQGIVGGGQAQGQLGAAWVEVCRLQQLLDIAEQLLDRRGQLQRTGSGQHAALGADEQRVAEAIAQAHEHAADRRLGQRQALGGAGHAALVEQGVQGLEEVEVEVSDIRLHDGEDTKWRLALF